MDGHLEQCVDLLKENENDVRDDAECVLLALCQNILSCPEEKEYREVRLDNPTFIEKLLPATGAMECLFAVGFTEAADRLFLPREASLLKLQTLQNLLVRNYVAEACDVLPAATTAEEKKYLREIMQQFQRVMRFEDPTLQVKARKLIPVVDLEIATMSRMRKLQKHIKSNQLNLETGTAKQYSKSDIDARDLFLAELLHWFKHTFFTWTNAPKCPTCFGECTYNKTVTCNDPRVSRIELYRCTNCQIMVKFPRYFDPEPLLTLRHGRCGEWGIVFTLFCRSLNYDARLVSDKTDHLWTEVWSTSEKRWIHVDPCENVMDRPLMYEKGWKKKLSYIIAYSKDEVQDVTWRYTRDQIGVMKRRKLCNENNLLQFIESLNKQRQFSAGYSAVRRQYVIKRRLLELVELIRMPNEQGLDNDENYEGRSTGSYLWRLERGEVAQKSLQTSYVWDISKYGRTFQLHYSVVKDTYNVVNDDGKTLVQKSGWGEGVNAVEGGIFRKSEDDWKVVYLARSPGATYGKIKWNFEVTNPSLCIWTFDLRAIVTVFHGASTSWEVEAFFDSKKSQNKSLVLPIHDCSNYHTDELRGAVKLILTATVMGGQGDNAWQHAQLFRQSLENVEERSMIISIGLNDQKL